MFVFTDLADIEPGTSPEITVFGNNANYMVFSTQPIDKDTTETNTIELKAFDKLDALFENYISEVSLFLMYIGDTIAQIDGTV